MQNRKDLLQAHRLMTQRAALALMCGDPDTPNQPLRRLNIASVSGVLAGAIAAGIFVVLGLLAPGSVSGLTQPGTLVVDKDTATPYVPCQDGKLCPALNYASALLALDTANVSRVQASQASLARYPIGPTIGIAGLPQDLPTAADLIKGPWSVCEQQASGGPPRSTLVGGRAVGGTPLGTGTAVLVSTGQGGDWVLWDGQRLSIAEQVMLSLFGSRPPQDVPDAWLDALPQGPDFAAPDIAGQGNLVAGPAGGLVPAGKVFLVTGSNLDYVMLASGQLASISPTQAQLLEREPSEPAPQTISPSQLTSHLSGTSIPDGGLPAQLPTLAGVSSPLCVGYPAAGGQVITAGGTVPSGAAATGAGAGQVDQVWLPPDHGALVGALAAPGSTSAALFLLTGATRYPLSAPQVASVLGYQLGQVTTLPASVLDLVPQGPALDPAAATVQASAG